jgi:glycosyltransferase involved in cell wall biosynthesis
MRINQSPLVSIIINNYNYGRFLHHAIESALNQTYGNTEVIVVDDGSTDNSWEVIDSFGNRIIPVFKKNGGQASAMNAGYAASRGDILCLMDSDDLFNADKAEIIVNFIRNLASTNPYVLVYHLLEIVDIHGNSTGGAKPRCVYPNPPNLYSWACKYRFVPYDAGPTSAIALTREMAEIIFPLPEQIIKAASDSFVVYGAELLGEVYGINQKLGRYRIHGKNDHLGRIVSPNLRLFPKSFYSLLNNYLNEKLIKSNKNPIISYFDSLYASSYYYHLRDWRSLVRLSYRMVKWHTDLRTIKWSFIAIYYAIKIMGRSSPSPSDVMERPETVQRPMNDKEKKKRCLFFSLQMMDPLSGVTRKVLAQCTALEELFTVELLTIKFKHRLLRALDGHLFFPLRAARKIWVNKGCIVYYRYFEGYCLFNWLLFLLKKRVHLYVEINTKLDDELRKVSKKSYFFNKLSERVIYKSASTIFVITEEVGEYVKNIEPGSHIKVIGNGYDPVELDLDCQNKGSSSYKNLEKFISLGGDRRKFIWVGGVSYWDGLDKIIAIMSHLENSCLYLVGNLDRFLHLGIDPETTLPDRVFFLGQRNLRDLKLLYAHCHFGFGSFGQERKNMQDNPTLKVREYLYYGLPAIIGHIDLQLQGVDFIHSYRDMEGLRLFLERKFDREAIKQYARDNLSWRTIMRNIFVNETKV